METTLDLTADTIDVRDIIERYEELVSTIGNHGRDYDDDVEMNKLAKLLDELKGYGGDEQWRGDWYPATLIHKVYFVEYVKDMLEDCGDIPSNLPNYIQIDWFGTARNIQIDYFDVEIDGVTYLYR